MPGGSYSVRRGRSQPDADHRPSSDFALGGDRTAPSLDEPTAHVDTQAEHGLFDLLAQLRQRMAIVMASHDVGLVSHHVDRVACLNRTLVCHSAVPLAAGVLERLYGMPVGLVDHHHAAAPTARAAA